QERRVRPLLRRRQCRAGERGLRRDRPRPRRRRRRHLKPLHRRPMRSPLSMVALALALPLAGAGCWTTTVGSISDPRAQRWLADNASSEMVIETADRAPDRTGVLIQAASPTEISFRTRETTVVPIERIRRLTVVK